MTLSAASGHPPPEVSDDIAAPHSPAGLIRDATKIASKNAGVTHRITNRKIRGTFMSAPRVISAQPRSIPKIQAKMNASPKAKTTREKVPVQKSNSSKAPPG